jgi:hypothetical protein
MANERLIQSLKLLINNAKPEQSKAKFLIKLLIAFIVFAFLRIAEYYIAIKLQLARW